MIPAFTHLALHVRDLEACMAFYRDYCGMKLVHEREDASAKGSTRVVWLAEPGREQDFIIVLLPGGPGRDQEEGDFSHLGFALDSKAAVDAIAERGKDAGCLAWARDDEIKRAIVYGISRDGRQLLPFMGFSFYERISDQDLDAIVTYLRSLPPSTAELPTAE